MNIQWSCPMVDAKTKKPQRTAPPEIRRKQLIEATITSISQNGIPGTTMTTVTRQAGLSLGLVNFHFKNKDNLLEETLRFLAEEHRDQWANKITKPGLSAAQKVNAIIDAQFHPQICSRKKLTVWFAFFGEAAYRKSYRSITTRIDTERLEVLEDLFQQIISDGDSKGIDARGVARTLEGLFDGFWLNMLMYPVKFTRADAVTQLRTYLATTFPSHFQRDSAV
jgi:TetR/AcrR family transcriptional regulator, transcriptional repressor of bet genes